MSNTNIKFEDVIADTKNELIKYNKDLIEKDEELELIKKQINDLEKKEQAAVDKMRQDLWDFGGNLSLSDIEFENPYYYLLTTGSVIANGFNDNDINESNLNLIYHSTRFNQQQSFIDSTIDSFFNLSDKNKLTFCLFFSPYFKIDNLDSSLSFCFANFPMVYEYLFKKYKIVFKGHKKEAENKHLLRFSPTRSKTNDPNNDFKKNKIYFKVEIISESLAQLDETKNILKQLKEDGYNNGICFHENLSIDTETKKGLINIIQ